MLGTYLHGLFDNGPLRRSVLRAVAAAAGRATAADQLPWGEGLSLDDELDRLADIVRQSIDLPRLYAIAGLQPRS